MIENQFSNQHLTNLRRFFSCSDSGGESCEKFKMKSSQSSRERFQFFPPPPNIPSPAQKCWCAYIFLCDTFSKIRPIQPLSFLNIFVLDVVSSKQVLILYFAYLGKSIVIFERTIIFTVKESSSYSNGRLVSCCLSMY